MIEVASISKSFGSVKAVDQLSLTVEPGKMVGLLGPNGAGKTTTMRCMCGISPADSGKITINGIDIAQNPMSAKAQLAFVPAEPRLFDYLTVREHISFFARLYAAVNRVQQSEEDLTRRLTQRGEALIAELDLEERASFLPSALSRGMKQKLMIASALVHDPRVLVFDEPFTGLDPHAIRKVRVMLNQSLAEGACVIISSHLLGMVEDMVNHVIIIDRGKKKVDGTIEDLRQQLKAEHHNADLEEIFIQLTSDEEVQVEA